MRHLIKLMDFSMNDIGKVYKIADYLLKAKADLILCNKTIVLILNDANIYERIAYEKGIQLLGGSSVYFPSLCLCKDDSLEDTAKYLNQWSDGIIIMHEDVQIAEELTKYSEVPVLNACSSDNCPIEILSDLYAVSKRRENYRELKYVYVGGNSRVGKSWMEAASVFGLNMIQCCPKGYELEGASVEHLIQNAVKGRDIILMDTFSYAEEADFKGYQVTKEIMESANTNALLSTRTDFVRGREVSEEVIDSSFFAGHSFKKVMLQIQQALMLFCMD